MKRLFICVLAVAMLLTLTACGKTANQSPNTQPTTTTKTTAKMVRPLSERIVCIGCYCDDPTLRAKEMDINEVYEVMSTVTCSICGAVDGETAKFGDTVFVLAE